MNDHALAASHRTLEQSRHRGFREVEGRNALVLNGQPKDANPERLGRRDKPLDLQFAQFVIFDERNEETRSVLLRQVACVDRQIALPVRRRPSGLVLPRREGHADAPTERR